MLLPFLAAVAFADLPAGAPVGEAVAVQVSAAGLDAVADVVPALVPADPIAVDPISDSSGGFCFEYSYELSNTNVALEVLDVSITPSAGELLVSVDLIVAVNDPSDPFTLLLDAICLIDEDCSGWIDPFPMTVTMPVALYVAGPPTAQYLEASIGAVTIDHALTLDELQTDCALNDIESVLNFFGTSLFDLVIGQLEDTLVETVETTLNEALLAASWADTLDVSGTLVDAKVQPASVSVTTAGLELVMAAVLDAAPDPCVASFDPGASVTTGGARPATSGNPPGTEAAAHLAGDFLNQALYAFWRGGLLCQQFGGPDLDVGLPIDTTLLGLIGGEPYERLFPEPSPMEIVTVPRVAPTLNPEGQHDLDLRVEELELAFMAELDGRMARSLGVAVDADVGADLVFDDLTGELSVGIEVTGLTPTLAGDLMVPGAEEEILASFESVVGSLLGTLLDGLLADSLSFVLPTMGELGVTSAEVAASGPSGDWVGLYATVGSVAYADPYAEGCGCSGEACGGCSSTGGTSVGWLLVALLVARRRR